MGDVSPVGAWTYRALCSGLRHMAGDILVYVKSRVSGCHQCRISGFSSLCVAEALEGF